MDQKKSVKPEDQQPPAGDGSKKTESEGLNELENINQENPVDQQSLAGGSNNKMESNDDQEKPEDRQSQAGGGSEKTASEGLNKLAKIIQVMIKMTKKLEDRTKRKYEIQDSHGNHLFIAKEEGSDYCTSICCGAERPFDVEFKDQDEIKTVIHLKRPFMCQAWCFPGCLQYLEVSLPDGNIVGTVKQEWSIFYSKFNVCDQEGNVVMKITSPFRTNCTCWIGQDFKLTLLDGKEVGKIDCSRDWSEVTAAFRDVDYFGVSFPEDLDVNSKATLIGAAMLIHFMNFEHNVGCLDILLCHEMCCYLGASIATS